MMQRAGLPGAADSRNGSHPPQVTWLGWDGHTLRWQLAVASGAASELVIDRISFERLAGSKVASSACERTFDYSPTGNAELEFSLRVDGERVGAPWRVRFAEAAVAGVDCWTQAPHTIAALAETPRLPAQPWPPANGIVVIVPIHDAPDSVRRCLAALARWTPAGVHLTLVDDASTDPAIAPLLAEAARQAHVRIERNARNRGYTHSVNLGIALAGAADVVLLNSDAEVGPRWLQSLWLAAYGDATVGTATAVSDNAGAFSVPELEQYCPIPERWDLTAAQRAVLQQAGLRYPELPTGNGFCMYVKRELIARIGSMDEAAFPSGYGEENDFCQRAIRAGWRNVIAGNVLVRHERSASFGDARRVALGAQGMAVLRARYPNYEADVGATLHSFARRVLDYRVRRVYAEDGPYRDAAPRARVLLCASGRARAVGALAERMREHHECYVLLVADTLELHRVVGDAEWQPLAAHRAAGADEWLARWIVVLAIERVYVAAGCAFADSIARCASGLGIEAAPLPP